MSSQNPKDRETRQPAGQEEIQPGAKKRYLKPAFRHEQVFETMALACGKVQQTQGACHMVRKNS